MVFLKPNEAFGPLVQDDPCNSAIASAFGIGIETHPALERVWEIWKLKPRAVWGQFFLKGLMFSFPMWNFGLSHCPVGCFQHSLYENNIPINETVHSLNMFENSWNDLGNTPTIMDHYAPVLDISVLHMYIGSHTHIYIYIYIYKQYIWPYIYIYIHIYLYIHTVYVIACRFPFCNHGILNNSCHASAQAIETYFMYLVIPQLNHEISFLS